MLQLFKQYKCLNERGVTFFVQPVLSLVYIDFANVCVLE